MNEKHTYKCSSMNGSAAWYGCSCTCPLVKEVIARLRLTCVHRRDYGCKLYVSLYLRAALEVWPPPLFPSH